MSISADQNMDQMRDLLARLLARIEELGADPLDGLAEACRATIAARPSPDLLRQAVVALEPFASAWCEYGGEEPLRDRDVWEHPLSLLVNTSAFRSAHVAHAALTSAHKGDTE